MTSVLLVDTIKNSLDSADTVAFTGGIKSAGSVVAVHQFTAAEQTITSATNVINSTFTPKFDNSKYFVTFTIPNLTLTAGNYFQADAYIGTDTTYSNNTKVIYTRTSGQGTGASNTQTLCASDYGSYTATSSSTHTVTLRCTPESSTAVARHSATVKMQVMEIAQ